MNFLDLIYLFLKREYLQSLKFQRHKKVDSKNWPSSSVFPPPPTNPTIINFLSPGILHEYVRKHTHIYTHTYSFPHCYMTGNLFIYCSTSLFAFHSTMCLEIPPVSAPKGVPPFFVAVQYPIVWLCQNLFNQSLLGGIEFVSHPTCCCYKWCCTE